MGWSGAPERGNPDGAVRYGTFALLGQQLMQCPEALEMTPGAPFSCSWTDREDRPIEGCENLSFRQSVPPKRKRYSQEIPCLLCSLARSPDSNSSCRSGRAGRDAPALTFMGFYKRHECNPVEGKQRQRGLQDLSHSQRNHAQSWSWVQTLEQDLSIPVQPRPI